MCGYPLCDTKLGEVPKHQFKISLSQKKVFDITERKSYCSNKCYKSSIFLKEQVLTSPLWIRKEDDVLPDFKLLSFDEKGEGTEKKDADAVKKDESDVKKEEEPCEKKIPS